MKDRVREQGTEEGHIKEFRPRWRTMGRGMKAGQREKKSPLLEGRGPQHVCVCAQLCPPLPRPQGCLCRPVCSVQADTFTELSSHCNPKTLPFQENKLMRLFPVVMIKKRSGEETGGNCVHIWRNLREGRTDKRGTLL